MSRQQHPCDQRFVERLLILNDRGVGVLTRVYNIKKACGDTKSKPNFLNDKSLESCIKSIVRRFPTLDVKNLQPIKDIRENIVKSLSLYYNTFVDLLGTLLFGILKKIIKISILILEIILLTIYSEEVFIINYNLNHLKLQS